MGSVSGGQAPLQKTGVVGGRTCEIPGKTNQYFRR
jgi:hypothetical protein